MIKLLGSVLPTIIITFTKLFIVRIIPSKLDLI